MYFLLLPTPSFSTVIVFTIEIKDSPDCKARIFLFSTSFFGIVISICCSLLDSAAEPFKPLYEISLPLFKAVAKFIFTWELFQEESIYLERSSIVLLMCRQKLSVSFSIVPAFSLGISTVGAIYKSPPTELTVDISKITDVSFPRTVALLNSAFPPLSIFQPTAEETKGVD